MKPSKLLHLVSVPNHIGSKKITTVATELHLWATIGANIIVDTSGNSLGYKCLVDEVSLTDAIEDAISKGYTLKGKNLLTKLSNCAILSDILFDRGILQKPNTPQTASSSVTVAQVAKKKTKVELATEFELSLAQKYINKAQNAKSRGIEFSITLADMRKLLKSKTCYYTGVDLCFSNAAGGAVPPNLFTIERIDGDKGYVKGNVVACSYAANQWKSIAIESFGAKVPQLSIEQICMIVNTIAQHGK